MAAQKPVKISKKEIENAEKMWENFIAISKYGIYITAFTLIALAAAFVDF